MMRDLPVELLYGVLQNVQLADLPAVARTSRLFREISTPIIYRSIILDDDKTAIQCCRSLSDASDGGVASMIHSFTLENFGIWKLFEEARKDLAHSLALSIQKMVHLEHYRCTLPDQFGPEICAALSLRTTLKTLVTALSRDYQSTFNVDINPSLPNLHTLEFDDPHEGPFLPQYECFLRRMLCNHSQQLKTVSLRGTHSDHVGQLLVGSGTFSVLESLTIHPSVMITPLLAQMPNVRSLTIPYRVGVQTIPSIPTGALPRLEYYSGPHRCLPSIIPGRPLRTVILDGALFDTMDPLGDRVFHRVVLPEWSDVLKSLQSLAKSTGPVRDLRVYLSWIDIEALPEATPVVNSLESLTICLRDDPRNIDSLHSLGPKLLVNMPSLHTFLLGDEPINFQDHSLRFHHFPELGMQLKVLGAWEKCCPTLQKVAFTAKFSWEKKDNTWIQGPSKSDADADDDDNDNDNEDDEYDEDGGEDDDGNGDDGDGSPDMGSGEGSDNEDD